MHKEAPMMWSDRSRRGLCAWSLTCRAGIALLTMAAAPAFSAEPPAAPEIIRIAAPDPPAANIIRIPVPDLPPAAEIIRIAPPDGPIRELLPPRPLPESMAVTAPLRVPIPDSIVVFDHGAFESSALTEAARSAPVNGVPQAIRSPALVQEVAAAPLVNLGPKAVPISLDTVLCLTLDKNGQVRLAREKLQEAYAEQQLAGKRWLPDLWVGAGVWRHEGGIQDFDGNLLRSSYGSVFSGLELHGKLDIRDVIFQRLQAERKVWQQQGELSRFSNDQLLDAASTYVDLLAARTAEAIGLEAEAKLNRLLGQARSLEKIDAAVRIEVARAEAELGAQQMLTRRLRQAASAAAAKLLYLLGLDPTSELVLLEKQLVAFRLVDAHQPIEVLVETALRSGPGMQELQAILGVLEEMRAKGNSAVHWLPALEVRMAEGAFAAGPGSQLDWANRWDLGVQARWNMTEFLTKREHKRLADLQIRQAHLSYQDMRGKLTLGVQEAVEAVRSTEEQLGLATRQIAHAEESYNLSDQRLTENIKGRSPSEVLLAIRSLVGARLGYLNALRDHDKAQVRLYVLIGSACPAAASR
jgi:outer membrane protein TolC